METISNVMLSVIHPRRIVPTFATRRPAHRAREPPPPAALKIAHQIHRHYNTYNLKRLNHARRAFRSSPPSVSVALRAAPAAACGAPFSGTARI